VNFHHVGKQENDGNKSVSFDEALVRLSLVGEHFKGRMLSWLYSPPHRTGSKNATN
jgi:hypothetical protein